MDQLQDQLMRMRSEAEEKDAQKRALSFGLQYLSRDKISVSLDSLSILPEEKARRANLIILDSKEKKLAIALFDPKYSGTKEILGELEKLGFSLSLFVVSLNSLNYALSFYKFAPKAARTISGEVEVDSKLKGEDLKLDSINDVSSAIILSLKNEIDVSDLVEIILLGALKNRASDIHFEPNEKFIKLRYRIDGNLNDVYEKLSHSTYRLILSRVKMLSNLKLNIKDEPQDGRFSINILKKSIEVRVAIAPSEFGEVVVARLLDPESINLDLKDLGLRDDDLKIIDEQLKRPYGMILNTGPTGSGKTTTLYAFLKKKSSSEIKIITIEDPIEYHLDGIEQTQVNNESGYTFASGLRSLMRQDPDAILVGEIRDKETAEIATQAALTGHLVFSTIHANEASGAIPRLLDLGAKPESLAPALNLLIAQRLVRKLCDKCKKEANLSDEEKEKIKNLISSLPGRVDKNFYLENMKFYSPSGCSECNNSGFKGRVGIYELLEISPKVQELIIKKAGQIEIDKEVKGSNFVSIKQDGILKVVLGITTIDEVESVAGKIFDR